MKTRIYPDWQKPIFAFYLITIFLIGNSFSVQAQTPPGISISWDKEIGCQTYEIRKDGKEGVFLENIEPSDCIRFCENSSVTYTLANVPSTATVLWNPVGGMTYNNNSTSCTVNWGSVGSGSLSFTITDGNSITSKVLCIEKVAMPKSLFDVVPFGQQPIITCANQQIDFTNLSTTNNGTNLISYLWDFGDGHTSTAFEPSHTYTNPGGYTVVLTVRNECNCTDVYKMDIKVEDKGFEISCPTVICEGQTGIYSLPQHVINNCGGNFNWSVVGGQILSQSNGQVEVLWDNVDQSGFGYVTFDPSPCDLHCPATTTVKVPVIQTHGTIQGITSICLGEQGRYKLPQWPTTEIEWEIVGNSNNNLGVITQTDQRNEVIVTPYAPGTFTLRATYTNTLLKCSGEAEFTFNVELPLSVSGESVLCENGNETYTNSSGTPVDWTLTTNMGALVTTLSNSIDFNYTFNQAGNYILSANKTGYCSGEQKTITVVGKPDAPTGVIGDLFVCPNSPYSYSVQNPDATSTYFWEIDPMYGAMVGSNEGDQVNITFNGTFPAEIKVYQKTISPVECESDPLTIIINQIPIDVEISTAQTAVCANSLASYNAFELGSMTVFYTDGDDYTWSFENASGTVGASSLGSVTNGQGTNSIDVTWNNVTVTTTLDLVLNVRKCNIDTQFVREITLYPQTEIELIASPNPVCSGDQVAFTVQSSNLLPLLGNEIITWNHGSTSYTGSAGQTTHFFTMISNSTIDIGQVVSVTINNPSCGQPVTATTTVTVLPNPPAIATLTSGANLFCDSASVNAVITVSSNTTGLNNFQWYNGVNPIFQETGTSLIVTPIIGAGSFTFHAENQANGCISVSNPVQIFVEPCDTVECTINEVVTNTSSLTGCGEITFSGSFTTYSSFPIIESWRVLGPSPNDYTFFSNGLGLTGKPGNYTIIHDVEYECLEGGRGTIREVKSVVIPYEPDFSYVIECTVNNTFNIDLVDNSIFYAGVNPQNINFTYLPPGGSSFIPIPNPYNPAIGSFEISGAPAGSYTFKVTVDGNYPGTTTYVCEKEYTVNLQGVDPGLSISNTSVQCHNTAVKFNLNPVLIPGSSVFWDFNDDGAQNTLPSPERVFNTADTTYTVSAAVTNELGCSAEFTKPVTIPKECFFGDIVSTPNPATVCQNETVDLTYEEDGDNCLTGATYLWMDGNTHIGAPQTSNTLTVGTTGFYWVKVISANGCEYSSPTQIRPLFKTLPTVKLIGESTACVNEDILFSVYTNATDIKWYLDNVLNNQFDDLTEADFTGLSPGNYELEVVVTSAEGCSNSAILNFSVVSPLNNITFNEHYSCSPYNVVIDAIPNPTNPNITYNWSNGESTQSISVPDGGPYRVTASLGGCSLSKEIIIAKNPEDYLWIYPSGCYTDCYVKGIEESTYLIGPTLPLTKWSWNESGNVLQSGVYSFQPSNYLMGSGSYSSTINTGHCELESGTLEYTTKRCKECEIKAVKIKEVYQNNGSPCSFTFDIVIYSGSSSPIPVTLYDNFNNVSITPSSFIIYPGVPNNIQLTVTPQSSFSGYTMWTFQGTMLIDGEYVDCIYELQVEIPKCEGEGEVYLKGMIPDGDSSIVRNDELKVYPNPGKDRVNVQYDLSSSGAELEVYDLSGRSISKNTLTSEKGELSLNTSKYQAGVYIVVLRQSNGYTMQQKLIIE